MFIITRYLFFRRFSPYVLKLQNISHQQKSASTLVVYNKNFVPTI